MATRILIPTPLRPFTDRKDTVEAEGKTVGELLADLTTRHAGLKAHLYSAEGKLRSFVNVYVNDEDIRYLQKEQTPVNAGDTVSIIPSVAGGAPTAAEAPAQLPELTKDDFRRYSRHLILPEVGVLGQQKLKAAKVLCIGAGGLGSPVALYLGAAGVGTIGIVDFDVVDFSNLQRQILHGTSDVGRSKLDSAKDRLLDINPNINVVTYNTALSSENALEIFAPYDIVVDGTDNFPTRYLVNDACVILRGQAERVGSIFRFEGRASVFATKRGPCYRCLYPEPPPPGLVPSCAEGGVLGVCRICHRLHSGDRDDQADSRRGRAPHRPLPHLRRCGMKFRELKLKKDPDCPLCGKHRTVTKLIDYEQFCGVQSATEEPVSGTTSEISAADLKKRLDRGDRLTIVDVREPNEYQINKIGGSILIPLGDIPRRYVELDPSDEYVMQCKVGARSAKAADFLRSKGFKKVLNLTGGIISWIDQVDPSQPKY
jgi:adenylyltransferase/sulfurtransferase